jgi:hypothetical protein
MNSTDVQHARRFDEAFASVKRHNFILPEPSPELCSRYRCGEIARVGATGLEGGVL